MYKCVLCLMKTTLRCELSGFLECMYTHVYMCRYVCIHVLVFIFKYVLCPTKKTPRCEPSATSIYNYMYIHT